MQQISIVSIQQVSKVQTHKYLSSSEMNRYLNLSVEKKKMSFLAGRIASKLACQKTMENVNPVELEIVNDTSAEFKGRPLLFYKHNIIGKISLTHSQDLACALFDKDENIGIDLEYDCSRNQSFYKFNFTLLEKDLISCFQSTQRDRMITLLWTAKEAMSKVVGKGLTVDARNYESYISKELLEGFMRDDLDQISYQGKYTFDGRKFDLNSRRFIYNNLCYYLTTAKNATFQVH